MNHLSRRLEAIAALDYNSYDEWKKDFDDEAKTDYEIFFTQFLTAKKFTVKSIKKFFAMHDECMKRLARLRAWADVDYAKVTQQTPRGMRHPVYLVYEREKHLFDIFCHVEDLMRSRNDDIRKALSNAHLSRKIKLRLKCIFRYKSHCISYEEHKALIALMASHTPVDRLIRYAIVFARVGIESIAFFRELAVAQVARIARQRYSIAKAYHYTSSLEAAFFPRMLPVSIYKLFLSHIRSHVDKFHRYIEIIKKVFNLEVITPTVSGYLRPYRCERQFTLEDAISLSVAACAPLGKEYVNALHEGLTKHRWVEADGIRKDYQDDIEGLAIGEFGGPLKIFSRFEGTLEGIFILIHEAGHCMHSLFMYPNGVRAQPIDMLVLEAVAECNEYLLWLEMCRRNTNHQAYLCCKLLDTFFLRIMNYSIYAELELFWHETIENGLHLNYISLTEKFYELIRFYYGNGVMISNDFLHNNWLMKKPYHESSFRIYNRAFITTASVALAERMIKGGKRERNDYLAMLRSNPLLGPVTILSKGGLDLISLSWIDQVMETFDQYLDRVDKCLKAKGLAAREIPVPGKRAPVI